VRSINPPIVRRESGQLRPSGGERIVILREEREREGMPVPPVRALKEDRSSIVAPVLCPYCARVRKLHYHRHHPKRIDISPLPYPASPHLFLLSIMLGLGSLARDPRDHRRAAECAKVGRERVSKERPSDAPTGCKRRRTRA